MRRMFAATVLGGILGGLITAAAIWAVVSFQVPGGWFAYERGYFAYAPLTAPTATPAPTHTPTPTPTPAPPALHCLQGSGDDTLFLQLSEGVWVAGMSFRSYPPEEFLTSLLETGTVESGKSYSRFAPADTLSVFVDLTPEKGNPLPLLERNVPWTQGLKLIEGEIIDLRESSPPLLYFAPDSSEKNDSVLAEAISAQAVFRITEQSGTQVLRVDAERDWTIILHNRPLDEYPQPLCPNFE